MYTKLTLPTGILNIPKLKLTVQKRLITFTNFLPNIFPNRSHYTNDKTSVDIRLIVNRRINQD